MKKNVLFLIVSLILYSSGFVFTVCAKSIGIELYSQLGISQSKLWGDEELNQFNQSSKQGVNISIGSNFIFAKLFSLKPEFNIVKKGVLLNYEVNLSDYDYNETGIVEIKENYNFTYFTFNILPTLRIPFTSTWITELYFGPEICQMLAVEASITNGVYTISTDKTDDFGEFDAGLCVGGAVKKMIQQFGVSLGFRFVLGLSNPFITDDAEDYYYDGPFYANRSFIYSMAFTWQIKEPSY